MTEAEIKAAARQLFETDSQETYNRIFTQATEEYSAEEFELFIAEFDRLCKTEVKVYKN